MPDVADRPVVKRGRRVSVLKLLGNPAFSTITVFLVENAAVTLKRLVCPRSQQADSLFVAVRNPIPAAELPGQILLRHPVAVGGHGVILQIDHIRVFRHVPYPELLFRIIPGIPVHLIITETGARLHRQTDPVQIDQGILLQPDKRIFHVLSRNSVLRFEILMKHADTSVRIIFSAEIQ